MAKKIQSLGGPQQGLARRLSPLSQAEVPEVRPAAAVGLGQVTQTRTWVQVDLAVGDKVCAGGNGIKLCFTRLWAEAHSCISQQSVLNLVSIF